MKGKISFVQILLLCVLAIGSAVLIDKFSEDFDDKNNIEKTVRNVHGDDSSDKTDTESETERLAVCKAFYELNNDTVGRIKIEDTNIDYPVLQNTQSNAYYLHRDFDREYSSSAVPFMDYQCMSDASDDNTIIYAHNMRNGTMFHDLLKYKDSDFCARHGIIQFDTLNEIGEYEVFAVFHTQIGQNNEFRYYDFVNAQNQAEFDEFVGECISRSIYEAEFVPEYGDSLLTLSTCSYNANDERFVVVARKMTV